MNLLNNIRYATRLLLKRKLFSLVVIVTMAIGIGASSAIFSFVNSVLLEPLPFKDPDQLVIVESQRGGERGRISQREIIDIKESTAVFEDIGGYMPEAQYNLTGKGEPEEIPANICSQNIFSILGASFVKGAPWPEELDGRRAFGVVISEDLWKRKFNSDNNIVNESITLDAYPEYTVFGVISSGFDFPKGMQMFRSATIRDVQLTDRNMRNRIGLARLRADATLEDARQQLAMLSKTLADKYPESNGSQSFTITPLRDSYIGPIKPYLLLVTIAVAFVLIIACVNVSNLLLSASAERDKEVAVRTVMGAQRHSIISQFLTESLLLSLSGGVLGIGLCSVLLYFFKDHLSQDLPHWITIGVNGSVLLFSFSVAVFSGLVAGMMPAIKMANFNPTKLLKEARGSSGGAHRHRLRKSLVIAELTLSIILLIGTFLLLKSFESLKRAELGFNPDNVLTYRVSLGWRKYTTKESVLSFYRQLLPELKGIPGVKDVSLNDNLPLSYEQDDESRDSEFSIEGQSFEEQKSNPFVKYQTVSPGYREMFEIPLLKGRWITDFDDTLTTPVTVINKSMATKIFKNEDPINKRIKIGKPDSEQAFRTIVGIVEDVRHDDMRKSGGNHIYLSCWQVAESNQFILIKTEGLPLQYAQQANKAVLSIDGDQSTYDMKTMTARIDQKLWQDRVIGDVFSFFAVISIILASVGIYSVMSYAISLRTKEFGVRRVMGADTTNILGIVFREALFMALISVMLGVVVSLWVTHFWSGILYQVKSWDLQVYGTVVLLSCFMAFAAALFPAWRATLINPVKALKNE
jgi:putative ABC transport system permease protein